MYTTLEKVRQYLIETGCLPESTAHLNHTEAEHLGFICVGITRRWRLVNAHLTDVAADAYIQNNAHRHSGKLRSFVPSQYRCYEFNGVINALKNGELVLKETV